MTTRSTHKKTTKTTHHAPVTESSPSAAEAATTATSTKGATRTPNPADVAAAANRASVLLQQLAATLPFDDPSSKDISAALAANRVPPAAMTIAASILEADPSRFPDLDGTVTRGAIAYDQALSPIVLQLEQLQERAAKTVRNRRGQGAIQTLALYQILKGLSRVSLNKATLVQQRQLENLLETPRKVRATSVTKQELKVAATGMKATKKAQAKAAKAAAASTEAQQAAALEAVLLGTSAQTPASALTPTTTQPEAAPAPVASPTPPAPAARSATVTPSH